MVLTLLLDPFGNTSLTESRETFIWLSACLLVMNSEDVPVSSLLLSIAQLLTGSIPGLRMPCCLLLASSLKKSKWLVKKSVTLLSTSCPTPSRLYRISLKLYSKLSADTFTPLLSLSLNWSSYSNLCLELRERSSKITARNMIVVLSSSNRLKSKSPTLKKY